MATSYSICARDVLTHRILLQETQEAGKTACSSDDVIQSVTKQLKFYLHVRRREDGFDASPSYIPRRAFPSLLPRPILQATRYDVPMKHHFSHSSVRSVLARLQSFQPHKPVSPSDPQTRRMLRTLNRCDNIEDKYLLNANFLWLCWIRLLGNVTGAALPWCIPLYYYGWKRSFFQWWIPPQSDQLSRCKRPNLSHFFG